MAGETVSLIHVNGFLSEEEKEDQFNEKATHEKTQCAQVNGLGDGEKLPKKPSDSELTLFNLLYQFLAAILSSEHSTGPHASSLQHRFKVASFQYGPLLPQATQNTGNSILRWVREGSLFRSVLVISVGTISFLALGGFLLFILFIAAATVNAIIISFLLSLAVAGGFLAFFFSCVTAIYIGAVTTAAFVISTFTVVAIFTVLVASGWIVFFWFMFLVAKKAVGLVRSSFGGGKVVDSDGSSSSHR